MRKPFPDYWHLKSKKLQLPPCEYAVSPSEWAKLGAWHLAGMYLAGHRVLSLFTTLSSRHQDHIHFHLQTSLRFSPPRHLSSSSAIWQPLPIWSPRSHIAPSTPCSMPPLEWSSQNAQLVMSHLCHLETREHKGCFRRAVLKGPPPLISSSQPCSCSPIRALRSRSQSTMTLRFSQDRGIDLHSAVFLVMSFMESPEDYVPYLGRRGWNSQSPKELPWSAGQLVP